MKYFYLIASAIVSLITAERVIHLNSDNFDAIVDGTRNVFVKFEASWCGPCKRMAPIMDQVAREAFPNLNGDTILAAIDADAEEEIGERFGIEAFPTIKLFLKGRSHDEAIDFTGERSARNIVNFIKHYVTQNMASLPEEIKNESPAVPLTKILEELARVGPRARNNEMVTNYHNFMTGAFDKALQPEQAEHKVINQKQKKNKSKSKKSKKTAYIPTAAEANDLFPLVNAAQAQSIIASAGSKPVILVFFSPNCPHCHEFIPLAEKLAEIRKDAIFIRVNGDANIEYRDSFNLRYYPSIIGFYANSNGKRQELMTSDRGYDQFNGFINKLIKH